MPRAKSPSDSRKQLLDDPSPAVRARTAAAAARRRPSQGREAVILDLAKQYDGKDRFYLEAIGIAVGHRRQGAARRHPRRLRQAVPRVERQGRRPRLGTAAAVDDADARQDSWPTPKLSAAPARPHRRHPRRVRRHGRRQGDARRAASRCAGRGARQGHREPEAVPARQVAATCDRARS